MKILQRVWCWFGWHDWTCAAEQGIKATNEQLADPFCGFWDYAKMYCKHCGTESRISRDIRAAHQRKTV